MRQPRPLLMSKAPFCGAWIVLTKHAHTHPAADRDGAGSANVTAATTTVPFRPVTRSWGSFQRLAQSPIQSLPLTDAHLAADGRGRRKRRPGVSPHSPGKAWEFLASLPAPTQPEKQIRKLPMVSFSLGNWVNATL